MFRREALPEARLKKKKESGNRSPSSPTPRVVDPPHAVAGAAPGRRVRREGDAVRGLAHACARRARAPNPGRPLSVAQARSALAADGGAQAWAQAARRPRAGTGQCAARGFLRLPPLAPLCTPLPCLAEPARLRCPLCIAGVVQRAPLANPGLPICGRMHASDLKGAHPARRQVHKHSPHAQCSLAAVLLPPSLSQCRPSSAGA